MDVGKNVEVDVPVGKELARVYLSAIMGGSVVEFWGKSGCGRVGGKLECGIDGSKKLEGERNELESDRKN